MAMRTVTNTVAKGTKVKALLGVSLLALGLSACGGDANETASGASSSDGLWTWSRPDAWYESGGNDTSAQPQQQQAATAQPVVQNDGMVQMTTRTYEIEEVSPVDGRVTRRTVTETVPVDQNVQMAQPQMQGSVSGDAGTVIPAGKLPTGSFGSSDQQNASYAGSLRGSMSGTVSGGVAMPVETTAVATTSPSTSSNVLVSASASGPSLGVQAPLVTSPTAAAASRAEGGFDNSYLDIDSAASVQSPYESVSRRAQDFDVQIVEDYDARWSDLEFDGGAQAAQSAYAAPQGTSPYLPMPEVSGGYAGGLTNTAALSFAAGSTDLSSSVRRQILETALAYREGGGVIEVFGQAASPNVDSSRSLSGYDLAMARANRVATALRDAGVRNDSIRVVVLGVTGQSRVDLVLR